MKNPLFYRIDSEMKPLVCSTLAIIGAPKSGKTSLARKIAAEKELIYLSVPFILTTILNGKDTSSLCENLKFCLESGEVVPDSLLTEAIFTVTSRVQNMSKGYFMKLADLE